MIVPQFWAEAQTQGVQGKKTITVRRFGWSDSSQEEAQTNAEQRSLEALNQILSGKPLERRERKTPYNGSDGVPIREEVLSRHGDTIISRNSYGAHCLNTPDVCFIDIDYPTNTPATYLYSAIAILQMLAAMTGYMLDLPYVWLGLAIVSLFFAFTFASIAYQIALKLKGGVEQIIYKRIDQFLLRHPQWNLRIYKTPAGMRMMATHRTFDVNDPEIEASFKELGADPMYARMCRNQQCFRARVSPKPWRIGIADHMRPRPGNWPVAPDRLPLRNAWIAQYEAAAVNFASCRFMHSKGSGSVHVDVEPVMTLHDQLARANSDLQIA